MIGYETERLVADLLLAIKDGEIAIERARQSLTMNSGFSPYAAFQRIDRDRNRTISAYEVLNFL